MSFDREAIDAAAAATRSIIRETPVIGLEPDAFGSPARLFLKLELLQHAGSFKARGAFNTMLTCVIPPVGVIAASGGNHGIAVAYAAKRLGISAEIFVPSISAPAKLRRLESYGAKLHIGGANYQAALEASQLRAAETGAFQIHAYDIPSVLAGQGTVGRELENQIPELETVLVACGGGGLIGGIAAWFDGRVRIVGVEPETAPTLHTALAVGRPVPVETSGLAADSLGSTQVGSLMFPVAQRAVERVVLVPEEAIRAAQRALWSELRLMVEPGGAAAMAALLCGAYRPAPGERVAVLVCGGNVDPATLG